jgi:hypothetical protein
MFDVIMLFYISLPTWSNIKLRTMVDRERFSVRVDHWVQKSGNHCYTPPNIRMSHSGKKKYIKYAHICITQYVRN